MRVIDYNAERGSFVVRPPREEEELCLFHFTPKALDKLEELVILGSVAKRLADSPPSHDETGAT